MLQATRSGPFDCLFLDHGRYYWDAKLDGDHGDCCIRQVERERTSRFATSESSFFVPEVARFGPGSINF